jgi:hypothetical protein
MIVKRGLVALGLIALTASAARPALAEEATGPTVVVSAADDPDVRAALTFPAGWRLEAAGDERQRSINALADDERCELSTRQSDFADLATDVDDFVVGLGPGSGFILIGRASVDLPAATSERVDFASEDGGSWSVYVVPDGGYMHELWCRADTLPDDRWLPIAQTFDIEPAADLASSPFEPRVERADAGVAMAFGEDWHVRGSSTSLGLLYATSSSAVCSLSDYRSLAEDSGWGNVDDMHEAYIENAAAREDIEVAESSDLELPAGRTGFAELSFDDGTQAVRYSFADDDGGALVALFCVGDPTPEDRYLELAASLTWTPPEQG